MKKRLFGSKNIISIDKAVFKHKFHKCNIFVPCLEHCLSFTFHPFKLLLHHTVSVVHIASFPAGSYHIPKGIQTSLSPIIQQIDLKYEWIIWHSQRYYRIVGAYHLGFREAIGSLNSFDFWMLSISSQTTGFWIQWMQASVTTVKWLVYSSQSPRIILPSSSGKSRLTVAILMHRFMKIHCKHWNKCNINLYRSRHLRLSINGSL